MRKRFLSVWAVTQPVVLLLVLVLAAVVLFAADGPLTPLMQLRGRTDANGYLMTASGTATGSDGPLTALANLRGRTDANGYLRVALSGAAGVSSLTLASTGALGWSSTTDSSLTPDLSLFRDAADVLAQRRGTNAQTLNVYNTYTDATNYERGVMSWSAAANTFVVGTEKGSGGGTARNLSLRAATGGTVVFNTSGSDRWSVQNGGGLVANADNNYDIGATGTTRPRAIFLAQPAITVGSGTGITVNDSGSVRDLVYKVTIASTAFVCAAVTCDVTIATIPADTWLMNVTAKLNTTFACTATCTSSTLSFILGKGAGGSEYLASLDADAATGVFGDADAELGTLLVRAAAIQGGTYHTASQAVVVRLTSGTGNIGNGAATNLSQGSIAFYLATKVLP